MNRRREWWSRTNSSRSAGRLTRLPPLGARAERTLGLRRRRPGGALDRQPLVGAPRLLSRAGRLTRPLDRCVDEFALPRRVGTIGDLPLALLVGESVTDLKLHWQDHERLTGHSPP